MRIADDGSDIPTDAIEGDFPMAGTVLSIPHLSVEDVSEPNAASVVADNLFQRLAFTPKGTDATITDIVFTVGGTGNVPLVQDWSTYFESIRLSLEDNPAVTLAQCSVVIPYRIHCAFSDGYNIFHEDEATIVRLNIVLKETLASHYLGEEIFKSVVLSTNIVARDAATNDDLLVDGDFALDGTHILLQE